MKSNELKIIRHERRKSGIRKRVVGCGERPRLTVFRSLKNIYAQIIDDEQGVTLCEASTKGKDLRGQISYGGNIAAAKVVGLTLAEKAKKKNIVAVCFDRNGFRYHGRLKALADAAREGGLKF
ncbi:MAG: 50S ribosomal protein L18 [Planctomycetota bacterium]